MNFPVSITKNSSFNKAHQYLLGDITFTLYEQEYTLKDVKVIAFRQNDYHYFYMNKIYPHSGQKRFRFQKEWYRELCLGSVYDILEKLHRNKKYEEVSYILKDNLTHINIGSTYWSCPNYAKNFEKLENCYVCSFPAYGSKINNISFCNSCHSKISNISDKSLIAIGNLKMCGYCDGPLILTDRTKYCRGCT